MAASDHKQKPPKCQIKKTRNGREHIVNCKIGYMPGVGLWQSHHLLPVSALNTEKHVAASDKNKEFIEDCLWITDWNINATPNVYGLDNKVCYLWNSVFPQPRNLPSHLIDHNLYTKEAYEYMEANVWDTLKDEREVHKLDPRAIQQELNDASEYFKGEIEARGQREEGTLYCWQYRHEPEMADTWYIPFSMSDDPKPRHPGVKYVPPWLSKLFQAVR